MIKKIKDYLSRNKNVTSLILTVIVLAGATMLKYIEGSLSIKNISISAAIIVIFIIISFLVFDYLQDSKFDNYIEKISDALTAVNMNWLMLDSEKLEIEKDLGVGM